LSVLASISKGAAVVYSHRGALMLSLIAVLLCVLAGAALTYAAIYRIKPESFKISVSITKVASFAMEIKLGQSRVNKSLKRRTDHTGNR